MKKTLTSTKPKRKRSHPYKTYLQEIRPVWKKNPEMVTSMIKDMVEKKGLLIERTFLMEFADRFLGIHEEKVSKVNPEYFEEIKIWVHRQRIQYITDVFLWLRNVEYEEKYWISDEYQLKYLEHQLELRMRYLDIKRNKDEFHRVKTEIVNQLLKGNYPDISKYDPFDVGRIFGWIQHIEILKEKRKDLLKADSFTTLKVPIEFKKEEQTVDHQLQINIPPGFFDDIQKESNITDQKSQSSIVPPTIPEPKFYTRSEVSEIMQISLPKLDQLTKEGILICYRIGDTKMKRYKMGDIQNALVRIETDFRRKSGIKKPKVKEITVNE